MKRKAFTLVELIVSLTIFTLLLGIIFYTFGVELRFWEKIVANSEKQQITNMVITRMTRDIRSATKVLVGSNSDKLLLKIGSDTLEYSLTNNKVRRKKNNYSSYLTVVGDIEQLSFSYPSAKLIEFRVDDCATKIGLRN